MMGRRIRDEMGLDVAGTLCFQLRGARCSITRRHFILALGLHIAKEMARGRIQSILGLFERHSLLYLHQRSDSELYSIGAANVSYLLAQYLFKHAEGRKSGAMLSRGHFIGRLAHHFGLVNDGGLRGLSIVAPPRQERQHDAAVGALGAATDAPTVDKGD
ncbi:hypothetical protein Tco_0018906 [Tanacetum coccineum]